MANPFYIEFTGDDRIKFEPKMSGNRMKGLRIKFQSAIKTQKVNYSVVGVEPFFEYEWLTVVKYDNLKGEAIKDLMKPTPVSFSPHGLHIKESWGVLDNKTFIEKTIQDLKKNWVELKIKYDDKLPPTESEKKVTGDKNLLRTEVLVRFLFSETPNAVLEQNKIYPNQTVIPVPNPEEDDWLLEQNSVAANRIEKRAHMGDPDMISLGDIKVLTYQKAMAENIQ
ncbi:MAG: hypothetical protein U0457_18870 [Candidatus Sericytochromatia bacterium]